MTFEKICLIIGLCSNALHLLVFIFLIYKSMKTNKVDAKKLVNTGISTGKAIFSALGITSVQDALKAVEDIKSIFQSEKEDKQ